MSYIFSDVSSIKLADSPMIDAFGRIRVSDPVTIFDSQLQYDKQPLLWEEKIIGGATSTHLPLESSVELEVSSTAGDRIIRQTKEYFRYQPGKSQMILLTFCFCETNAGVEKLIGYGDDKNGVFLGEDAGGTFMLLRSNVSGSVVEERVYQQNWNVDKLDGTTLSNITIDMTKTHIFITDIEWLGVGRVRTGFVINGLIYYVHEFNNANVKESVYMTTANLPCRYEMRNINSGTSARMKQICSQVTSEGGVDTTLAYPFSKEVLNVNIPAGEANAVVIFAARPKLTFNGIENRSKFIPSGYEALSEGSPIVTSIVYNPTINTVLPWESVDPSSTTEGMMNGGITSWSGGIVTTTSVLPSAARNAVSPVFGKTVVSRYPFGIGIDGDSPTILAMVAYGIGGSATASFTFQWEELR